MGSFFQGHYISHSSIFHAPSADVHEKNEKKIFKVHLWVNKSLYYLSKLNVSFFNCYYFLVLDYTLTKNNTMNGVALKLKHTLTCSNCSKIFRDPIELPCKHSICQEHLTEKEVLNQNKIRCSKCKEDFEVKGSEFKSIELVKQMLENKIYFNEEEIRLKQKIEESIKHFYEMHDTFTLNRNQLDSDSHNHFQEIRFQLDLHREKLKEKIDDIYMEMIEKTKETEASYLKSFNENFPVSFKAFDIKSLDEDLKAFEEKLRDPQLLIESIREMHLKQQKTIETMQFKLNEMSQVKKNLKTSNEFKPNLSFSKDLFGQLNLNVYSNLGLLKSEISTSSPNSPIISVQRITSILEFSP